MTQRENEAILQTIYQALSRADVGTILAQFADGIEFHVAGRSQVSGDYAGKEEVLGFMGKLMELSDGTFSVEVLDILANDTHGVALTMERGSRDGRTMENRAVHVWEIRDGKCQIFYGYNQNVWDEFWAD